jgi:hypothetical protein
VLIPAASLLGCGGAFLLLLGGLIVVVVVVVVVVCEEKVMVMWVMKWYSNVAVGSGS